MQIRKLSSLDVNVIGMGSAQTFNVSSKEDIAVRQQVMDNCIPNGVTFLDTSPMYGRSEDVLGMTTHGKGQKFQLATKVWCTGRAEGEAQIARSFELLRTDHIEVLQVHNLVDWATQLPYLEVLKEEGKIEVIGITHNATASYPEMIRIMKTGRIGAIQIPYNVMDRTCEEAVLPVAGDLGIGVIVMKPLGVGDLVTGLKGQPDLSPLEEYGIKTWAQALLAWILADERVSVLIPATSRPERIIENAGAGSVAPLPTELREHISAEAHRCL